MTTVVCGLSSCRRRRLRHISCIPGSLSFVRTSTYLLLVSIPTYESSSHRVMNRERPGWAAALLSDSECFSFTLGPASRHSISSQTASLESFPMSLILSYLILSCIVLLARWL
jgi:hypothetical protein